MRRERTLFSTFLRLVADRDDQATEKKERSTPVLKDANEPQRTALDITKRTRMEKFRADASTDLRDISSGQCFSESNTRINPRERFQTWVSDTEEYFKEFIGILKECLIFVDENLRFSHTNTQFPKLLGYERHEVVGKYVIEHLDPENRTIFLTQTERQKRGKGRPYELNWVRKDGGKIPTLIAPRVITDFQGSVRGFFSAVTDMSELKEAIATAKEKEAHFQSLLLSASGLALYRLAIDKADMQRVRVDLVSPSMGEIMGIDDLERFEAWDMTHHPDDLVRISEARRRALQTRKFNETYRVFNAKRGEWRWLQSIATGFPSNDGETLYFNGISIDVTEQKKAEEALKKNKETAHALLNATTDSAVIIEPDGTIIALNNAMANLLGKGRETLIGANWYDFFSTDMVPMCRKRSEEVFISGKVLNFVTNYQGECYDTRRYPVLDGTGKAYRLVVYARNITEKRRGEHILQKMEKELTYREEKLLRVNTALHVLLEKRGRDKEELEQKELANIRKLVQPEIERIKQYVTDQKVLQDLDNLEKKLQAVISPFASKLTSRLVGLTPMELRVADLVKEGKSSKEIANMLHLSVKTISTHRENIRKKLNLKNTKANMRTHLLTLFA